MAKSLAFCNSKLTIVPTAAWWVWMMFVVKLYCDAIHPSIHLPTFTPDLCLCLCLCFCLCSRSFDRSTIPPSYLFPLALYHFWPRLQRSLPADCITADSTSFCIDRHCHLPLSTYLISRSLSVPAFLLLLSPSVHKATAPPACSPRHPTPVILCHRLTASLPPAVPLYPSCFSPVLATDAVLYHLLRGHQALVALVCLPVVTFFVTTSNTTVPNTGTIQISHDHGPDRLASYLCASLVCFAPYPLIVCSNSNCH